MFKINEGTDQEYAVRLVLQENGKNEFFDDCENYLDIGREAAIIQQEALKKTPLDGVERLVGVALVPPLLYGKKGTFGEGLEQKLDHAELLLKKKFTDFLLQNWYEAPCAKIWEGDKLAKCEVVDLTWEEKHACSSGIVYALSASIYCQGVLMENYDNYLAVINDNDGLVSTYSFTK